MAQVIPTDFSGRGVNVSSSGGEGVGLLLLCKVLCVPSAPSLITNIAKACLIVCLPLDSRVHACILHFYIPQDLLQDVASTQYLNE